MAAVAQTLTDRDLLRMGACAGQGMIYDLAEGAAGTRSVQRFQAIWNAVVDDVRGVSGVKIPSKNGGKLVEDDLYGPQTATALWNFVQSQPPARSSDVATWFAANQGDIAQMCPPQPPIDPVPATMTQAPSVVVPTQTLPPAIPVSIPPTGPAPPGPEAYVAPIEEGPVVEVALPSVQGPATVQLEPEVIVMATGPESIKRDLQVEDAPGLVPPSQPTALPSKFIVARPSRGDVPVLAITVGGIVVAGVLVYWMWDGKKRRKR